jgi:hypothetical protein
MTTLQRVTAAVMLVSGGLWAGVIVSFAVERVNLWQRMALDQYAVDFRRSQYRVDPMQPILAVVCVIAAVVFAVDVGGATESLTWVGVGLVVAAVIWSVILMEPLNSSSESCRRAQRQKAWMPSASFGAGAISLARWLRCARSAVSRWPSPAPDHQAVQAPSTLRKLFRSAGHRVLEARQKRQSVTRGQLTPCLALGLRGVVYRPDLGGGAGSRRPAVVAAIQQAV